MFFPPAVQFRSLGFFSPSCLVRKNSLGTEKWTPGGKNLPLNRKTSPKRTTFLHSTRNNYSSTFINSPNCLSSQLFSNVARLFSVLDLVTFQFSAFSGFPVKFSQSPPFSTKLLSEFLAKSYTEFFIFTNLCNFYHP